MESEQTSIKTKPLFLQAFDGTNKTIPVWFMRQAGRYLPEYQEIRKRHSLEVMFKTSELAAHITCLPINILDVDAAILFADILTLPSVMGFNIHFDSRYGPMIDTTYDLNRIHDFDDIPHIRETIKLIKQELKDEIPLIGFAGSPFTVLTYLIEGGSSVHYTKTFQFMNTQKETYHRLMRILTENTVRYLQLQKDAGVDVFQLFDTWAGILRPSDYAHYVLPYVQRIFKEVDLPSIYYLRNSHSFLPLMDKTNADFLSVCHTVVLGHHSIIEKTKKGIQGNLFNGLLYADAETLKREVDDVLIGGAKHDRFIFNLSHGVFPDVDLNKLKLIVDQVHQYHFKR